MSWPAVALIGIIVLGSVLLVLGLVFMFVVRKIGDG